MVVFPSKVMNPADDRTTVEPLEDTALKYVSPIPGMPPESVVDGLPLKIEDNELVPLNPLRVELPVRVSKMEEVWEVTRPYLSIFILPHSGVPERDVAASARFPLRVVIVVLSVDVVILLEIVL